MIQGDSLYRIMIVSSTFHTVPSTQPDVVTSFGGFVTDTVTFSSTPGASLIQRVYFNLTDDEVALESVELVMVALNVSGAERTSIGDRGTTVLNILDNDGKL